MNENMHNMIAKGFLRSFFLYILNAFVHCQGPDGDRRAGVLLAWITTSGLSAEGL